MNPTAPLVHVYKTPFMQRLVDAVLGGHRKYLFGEVLLERAPKFAAKLDTAYGTSLTRERNYLRRKAGLASARLLMFHPHEEADRLLWFLLVTDGVLPPAAAAEKWLDALDPRQRITVTGYELCRMTKRHEPKPVWTWRYQTQRIDVIRGDLIRAVRTRQDPALSRMIHSLWRSPGFAGVRVQVKALGRLIDAEWRRHRGRDSPISRPKQIGYARRLRSRHVPIDELIAKVTKARASKQ